jgi:hypothetical protein
VPVIKSDYSPKAPCRREFHWTPIPCSHLSWPGTCAHALVAPKEYDSGRLAVDVHRYASLTPLLLRASCQPFAHCHHCVHSTNRSSSPRQEKSKKDAFGRDKPAEKSASGVSRAPPVHVTLSCATHQEHRWCDEEASTMTTKPESSRGHFAFLWEGVYHFVATKWRKRLR